MVHFHYSFPSFFTLVRCFPPSNFVVKKASIIFLDWAKLVKSAPKHKTFASLCWRDSLAASAVLTSAARTHENRFTAIEMPIPLPQMAMPRAAHILLVKNRQEWEHMFRNSC